MQLLLRTILFAALLFQPSFQTFAQKLDMKKLHGLKARSIGPAGMSGRVTSIDVVNDNPQIIYVGTASGGLWKSESGGTDWKPIFDTLAVASIGAVAVDQQNPAIVWAGTGEGNPRNSMTNGDGIYKSIDGGRSWSLMGLKDTRAIHRVIIHPGNSDVVYVGALGAPWGENPERGVYKTTDGGATWKKILYVDEKTGVADLVMDPSNPNKLIAAMWEYRRWPWFFKSGGPGSGLLVTFDGGATWTKRTDKDGLPEGDLGRIGLAIAPGKPERVYALIESKKNALYRSDDGGFKWTKVSDKNIGNRPFYYADIYVDPHNENRIYNLYSVVSRSEDAGKTFETFIQWSDIHPDHHAWWIHPDDPDFMIDGNDGGLAITRDGGRTWRFIENLPLAQFYHINVDNETPYNIYGGMQDNGSWRGPNEVWRNGGIRNSYWQMVLFGDGFDVVPDPANARYGYAMSQGGAVARYDIETGEQRLIRPMHPDGIKLRFHWNAGMAADPFDERTIYYGSQFLHKSTDRGETWRVISPDLTTNDTTKQKYEESGGLTFDVTAAENHTTILTIAPSPVKQGVIWVGTDDGNVRITTDGGGSWTNRVDEIPGVPEATWVPQIHPSSHDAGEAFVVFDNHRHNDWTPYVYHTRDYGKTWSRIADGEKVSGYALCIAQDRVARDLLFLGTEFGLYLSIDAGKNWTKWQNGYPTVSTMDLVIHPRDEDLVIGTFGRAAYVLDDIRPLRELAMQGYELMDAPLHLFPIPPAQHAWRKSPAGVLFTGAAEFSGENPMSGAMISFVFNPDTTKKQEEKEEEKSDSDRKPSTTAGDTITVRVKNSEGTVIRTFKEKGEAGLNRIRWGMNRKGVRWPGSEKPKPGAPEPGGPLVLPGRYEIVLSNGEHADSGMVEVLMDPRMSIAEATVLENDRLLDQLMSRVELATSGTDRLNDAKKVIERVQEYLKDRNEDTTAVIRDLKEKGKAFQDSIKTFNEMVESPDIQGIKSSPDVLTSKLNLADWYLNSSWSATSENDRLALAQAEEALARFLDRINRFFSDSWPEYKTAYEAADLTLFESYEPIGMEGGMN
ncbi:MAG: hypothetical protein OEV30_01205 [Ignavibacteria bacterium]|nr:hypothetical protein [Ignavibacteria bacterium]